MQARNWLQKPLCGILAGLALLAGPVFADDRFILQTATPSALARITSQFALTVVQTIHDDGNIFVVSLPPGASSEDVAAVQRDPAVVQFAADTRVQSPENSPSTPAATTLDPLQDALASHYALQYFGVPVRSGYVNQTATTLIRLAQTQQIYPTGNSIVAVIDTGVDPMHSALAGVLVPGYDFIHDVAGMASELADVDQSTVAILDQSTVAILDEKNSPLILNQSTVAILDQSTVAILDGTKLPKDFGHGTMVAGLIHLVAPTAQIMPLKAFQADGSANLSDVIRAIYYAVDHNAKVINMSFSVRDSSAPLMQAIQYASNHGVFSIASAGNEGKWMTVYPAGIAGVFSVASTNKHDLRSMFSNWGDGSAWLAAPGEALVTIYPGNNYAAVWGTSFSAALVSGAVAVIANQVPTIQHDQLSAALQQGPHIGNSEDGDARLDLLASMLFFTSPKAKTVGSSDDSGDDGFDH
jgi:subtilisin family serine protease